MERRAPSPPASFALAPCLALSMSCNPADDSKPKVDPPPLPPIVPSDILIDHDALMSIPMSGAEWDNIVAWSGLIEVPDPADIDSNHDVIALAAALRGKREGDPTSVAKALGYVGAATSAIVFEPGLPHSSIDVLPIARNVLSYVLAADLIDLEAADPALDAIFRAWLVQVRDQVWSSGRTLQGIHEVRPNNVGLVAGAARIAIDMYLGTEETIDDIAQAQEVFHAWVGDVTLHQEFEFGGSSPSPGDNSWQSTTDPSQYRGISPVGATLGSGTQIADGLMPDDQRRVNESSCCNTVPSYPACWGFKTNYVWEGLQGAVMQAHLLARCGYPAFAWEHAALDRALTWLYDVYDFPPENTGLSSVCNGGSLDDTWIPHITDKYYGGRPRATTFGGKPGKNCGFADWWSKGI